MRSSLWALNSKIYVKWILKLIDLNNFKAAKQVTELILKSLKEEEEKKSARCRNGSAKETS